MAIDDTYRVTITQNVTGQVFQNTYYFNLLSTTPPDAVMFSTVATNLKEAFRTQQSNSVIYRSWRAVQVRGTGVTPVQNECRTTGGLVFEGNFTTSLTGGDVTSDILPHQCSVVTTLNTGNIGRRRRGRVYLGGYAETAQQNGTWSSTLVTALTTSWNSLSAKYFVPSGTDADLRMGVWSTRIATGCVPRREPPYGHMQVESPNLADAFRPLTAYVLRTTVYTQRRRVVGVGR
jgi:hypothetical protein